YVLVDDANWPRYQSGAGDGLSGAYYGFDDLSLVTGRAYNGTLPPAMQTALKEAFGISPVMSYLVNPNGGSSVPSLNSYSIDNMHFLDPQQGGITYDDPITGHTMHILAKTPPNFASCSALGTGGLGQGGLLLSRDGLIPRDGFNDGSSGFTGTGVVEGTPTAIITKSDIQQTSLGGGLQVNFNLDQHKVMLGASIDQAKASYKGTQRLALLDDNRNVYSDPNQLGDEFYAAQHDIPINDFSGTTTTKSLYASETWSPIQTLNLSFSGRYNLTDVRNTLAPTARNRDLVYQTLTNQFLALWQAGITCPGDNLSNCPFDLSKPIPANYLTDIKRFATLDVAATEKFTYRSFNPAIGATWQAKPNLNLYTNWSQGTRAPSVVELGCAYDATLVDDPRHHGSLVPRSIAEGRGCSLPSALSGDPYLPQVKAQTVEVGARGKFSEFLEWNVSAYRTDLRDDIYMTSLTPELNFFQSIGDTRRQGIEFGLAGEYGKSDFRINYSLTEATFQSSFKMLSPNNSSRNYVINTPTYQMITVSPGNVMPGVPFNNINFNWGYKVSPKFKVNTSIVGHSDSFLRGNENNAHTPGPGPIVGVEVPSLGIVPRKLPDNFYAGKAPGYAVLNMNARYDFGGGWAFSALMNNVLDKKYYTAGRLGINPFAPSTFGAIGPGGFNYNSGEWIPSQFISPGAPRGVWLSVSYDFDAAKKAVPPAAATSFIEPDRTLDAASNMPTAAELALVKQLDKIKALPVL
ncbi:MAG: TonB-dependent receptor, partial [Methylotenera sp.]